MNVYWNKLSTRERALIMGAGGLFVLLILSLVIVRPLINYQAGSEAELIAAKEEYRVIASLVASYNTTQDKRSISAQKLPSSQSPRILISTSAREKGLIVSRIQPSEDGNLTLWMDSVSSIVFYEWLNTLEQRHSLSPNLASLQKNGDGTLRAQIQFSGVQ
ncbi:type II secretion system protein M [Kordiimonas aquimaris]|uniref:type II secretion system protein M n=1 Tax=Kordiimonas aquimaris TaxID=707591 RepID=UPI0021CFADB9|nr:type II secretion system protein M [Kordiimonas aquimaris]